MRKLNELKEEIDKMLSISFSSEIYFNDNLYLSKPDTLEENVVAQNDLFIKRAKYALGVMSIIQINKLFGKTNDTYSFDKFLNKLLNNHRNSEWKELIALKQIKEWQSQLSHKPMQDVIRKVNTLRDQYFAHSDRDPEAFDALIVNSLEMQTLLRFCNDVLLKISVDVFKEYRYSMTNTDKASGILKQLSIHVKRN